MHEKSQRFVSLDVFRGLTVCFMIIVNTPGGGAAPYSFLEHAEWHGFTPTDLVFPSFLFAVGNAMSFSLIKYQQISNAAFLKKVIKRTALIFLIGYLMYWFPFFRLNDAGHIIGAPISQTRIMGVLQRIALAYFFTSLLIHYCSRRTAVIVSIVLLLSYWITLLLAGDTNQPFSMLGNAGIYLDRFLTGRNHMYQGEGVPFDPEGWLSTMPAIVNVVVGYLAGKFIKDKGIGYETISKLMLAGLLLIFIALWWNMIFPINKKLWTSSFVLLTTGIDLILISVLIYIIEMRKDVNNNWTEFLLVFGKNPLFIYLLSEILVTIIYMIPTATGKSVHGYVSTNIFQSIAPGALGSLLFALVFMLLCWLVGWWMNRNKVYVRV